MNPSQQKNDEFHRAVTGYLDDYRRRGDDNVDPEWLVNHVLSVHDAARAIVTTELDRALQVAWRPNECPYSGNAAKLFCSANHGANHGAAL